MPQNLRARLARIRNAKGESLPAVFEEKKARKKMSGHGARDGAAQKCSGLCSKPEGHGSRWQETGYKVLCRTLTIPFTFPAILPETLSWLLPDLSRKKLGSDTGADVLPDTNTLPEPKRFLFFDLETTGLSGGAGTVAFLAAFGRFVSEPAGVPAEKVLVDYTSLEVTQFLLLDYPGESDFLEKAVSFITGSQNPPFLTTYNGKAFDIPLLKTRCLMNGLAVPGFFQADLLHPARRMWKRIIPNCSQATVETEVLGLDRTGDMPGSMAPDIWFNFLRSGEDFSGGQNTEASRALLGICDHNVKDILGLASLFRTFTEIAAAPLDAAVRFNVDEENLAMCWRRHFFEQKPKKNAVIEQEKTAAVLLEAAAKNYPRSSLRLGFDLFRQGLYAEGRTVLKHLSAETSWKVPCTAAVQALSLRSLAIDAERRLKSPDIALEYIKQALVLEGSLPAGLREDLEKRQERLQLQKKKL